LTTLADQKLCKHPVDFPCRVMHM